MKSFKDSIRVSELTRIHRFQTASFVHCIIMHRLISSRTERVDGARVPEFIYNDANSKAQKKIMESYVELSSRLRIDLHLSCGDKDGNLIGSGLVRCSCSACHLNSHHQIMPIEVSL
jgi:hypothetical protein